MDPSVILAFLGGVGLSELWRIHLDRRRARGLPGYEELIPYVAILPQGIVLLKDGSLLRCWRYKASARASLEISEREELIDRLVAALEAFDERVCFHFDVARRRGEGYLPDPGMRDPVSWAIDQKRGEKFSAGWYDTELYLSVSYLPAREHFLRFGKLFQQGRSGVQKGGFAFLLEEFLGRMEELENRLGGVFQMERLEGTEVASYLLECVTGLRQEVRVGVGDALEGLLGSIDVSTGSRPVLGEKHLRVVSVVGFPRLSKEGMLERLVALDEPYRFTTRFIPRRPASAGSEMGIQQNFHRMGMLNWFDLGSGVARGDRSEGERRDDDAFTNQAARARVWELGEARGVASEGKVRFGSLNAFLAVMDRSEREVEERAQRLVKVLQDLGFVGRIEGLNTMEAFRATWPGMTGPMAQRPMLHTGNLAHLVPLTAYWSGHHTNPSDLFPDGSAPLAWVRTAEGGSLFRFGLHSGDVGHFLALGSTGAGKSVLVGFLAAMFAHRYQGAGAQVVLLDFDYSSYLLTEAVGGAHYAVEPGGELCFQPLRHVDIEGERSWAQSWLTGLLSMALGRRLNSEEVERLHEGLKALASEPVGERTLSGLRVLVQHEEMSQALRLYGSGGVLGDLLDGGDDDLVGQSWQTFELRKLAQMDGQYSGPVIAFLIHRLDKLVDATKPTLFMADEAFNLLSHPVWKEEVKRWLVMARKKNTAVGLLTQSAAQLSDDGERLLNLILEQVASVILLPNKEAKATGSYAVLGLGEQELKLLRDAQAKRDYYFRSRDGRELIELDLSPLELAFFGSPGVGVEQRVRELRTAHGREWPSAWLRLQGLAAEAERLTELLRSAQAT